MRRQKTFKVAVAKIVFVLATTVFVISTTALAVRYTGESKNALPPEDVAPHFICNSNATINECLNTEEDIQHYAYLDLEEAEESIRPVILQARNIIVHRQSWVADGVSGRIMRSDGSVKQELPEFHDLFPLDWEIPVTPVEVDLSYYTHS